MPKRALIALATCAVATACISSSTPAVNFGTGTRFVPFVVDSLDNVGQGDAVALTSDGAPYVSYFGFQEELEKGEIATPRPFGAPTVPGVMLSTANTQGLWQRGAVQEAAPPPALKPNGVTVPFGPTDVEGLDLKPENTNGTAITLAGDGTVHMAWAAPDGIDYATSKLGGTASVSTVFATKPAVQQAGPIGRPSIALDDSGVPWIAFGTEGSDGIDIHVSTQQGKTWSDQIVATLAPCNDCPAPQPTGIGSIGGKITVVYADPNAKQIHAATLNGANWTDAVVATGTIGFGLSFAVVGDAAYVAAYTGMGEVDESTWSKGSWKTQTVSDVDDPDTTETGHDAANTAVSATSDGTIYVAWETADGIEFESGTDSFSAVDTGTALNGGADPALATSDNGVAIGWYDKTGQDQMLGFRGDLTDVVVAQPSPSLVPSPATGGGECSGDKAILDETAQGSTFTQTCLIAPANKPFEITFDNKDPIPHDISIYPSATKTTEEDALFYSFTDPNNGGTTNTYNVKPQKPGTYYFHCDFHPTTMTGTFLVSAKVK